MEKIRNALFYFSLGFRYIYTRKRVHTIYPYLLDSESRRVMRLREKYILHHDIGRLIKDIAKIDTNFDIPELAAIEKSKIVVCLLDKKWIAKQRMDYTKVLLEHSEWRDSYRCTTLTDDFTVNDGDIIVPVWGGRKPNVDSLKHKFAGKDINLHIPIYSSVLVGLVGKQYFDVFEPCQNEIVVDSGAFDGTTVLEIAQWTNYTYKKIYAFEPNSANCRRCKLFFRETGLRDIELVQKGTWSKDTTLSFSTEGESAGGKVGKDGVEKVQVTTIDDVVGSDKVTFIKMDVEGAELESLKGASETIKRDTPRLAICIYHKWDDLWIIPEYILKLNCNYRFYIRHYSSLTWETVLYAVSNEKAKGIGSKDGQE